MIFSNQKVLLKSLHFSIKKKETFIKIPNMQKQASFTALDYMVLNFF